MASPMTSQQRLAAMLDALETSLPAMIAAYRTDGEFWMAFAGEADLIEDQAGENSAQVQERIQTMLAKHGRMIAVIQEN